MIKIYLFILDIRRYYYVCCCDGDYRGHSGPRQTSKTRPHQKASRKLNSTCLSRMYVDLHSNKHVTVKYVAAHTGHTLEAAELQFLPLPQSTKDTVSFKLLQGVPTKRILQGNDTNRIVIISGSLKHNCRFHKMSRLAIAINEVNLSIWTNGSTS